MFWFTGNYSRYSGTREPETKAIIENLILKQDFSLSVALDGGSLLVTYPYDKPAQTGMTNSSRPCPHTYPRAVSAEVHVTAWCKSFLRWWCSVASFRVKPFVCGVDSLLNKAIKPHRIQLGIRALTISVPTTVLQPFLCQSQYKVCF